MLENIEQSDQRKTEFIKVEIQKINTETNIVTNSEMFEPVASQEPIFPQHVFNMGSPMMSHMTGPIVMTSPLQQFNPTTNLLI